MTSQLILFKRKKELAFITWIVQNVSMHCMGKVASSEVVGGGRFLLLGF
jgi:hypothetical protein